MADATDSNVSVNLTSNLSLSIKDNSGVENLISLNITPNATGVFSSASTNVIASTTNDTGYTITMSDADNNTSLVHEDTTITTNNTIPTLTSSSTAYTEANFPTNHYGYNFNNTTSSSSSTDLAYLPIPSLAAPTTLVTTTAQGNATYPFTIAAKVDTSLPAGTYKDTLTFSITANYVPQNPLQTISTMQQMNVAVCSAATIGDEATLTDTRDGKTYNIRKMEDGKCWMIQNLALGDTTKDITLTPTDSNVVTDFIIPASAVQTSGTTNWYFNMDSVHVYDNSDTWIEPTAAGNDSIVHTSGTPPNQSQYVGNYYNWYTATAGTGTVAMTAGNAISSICPKGWKLPTGGANSDFAGLIAIGGTSDSAGIWKLQSAPNYFVLSGGYLNGVVLEGKNSYWWSSTAESSNNAYFVAMSPSDIVQTPSGKHGGDSVRCVADNSLTGITTMQQMTSSICAATRTPSATETTVPENTLTDVRDGNTYLVRKLADGNCWMSQNLNLTLSTATALNSTTSDLSAGRTWTPENSTQTTDGIAWGLDGSGGARSFDPGNIYFPNGVGTGTADANRNLRGATSGQPWESIGNRYNWYAATAGTGTAAMISGVATDSICPKGWKLPDNEGNRSFVNLIFNTYGLQDNNTSAAKLIAAPLNFVRSGYTDRSNSQQYDMGEYGYWWSTAAYSQATSAHNLATYSAHVIPQYAGYKGNGLSVRCVAR